MSATNPRNASPRHSVKFVFPGGRWFIVDMHWSIVALIAALLSLSTAASGQDTLSDLPAGSRIRMSVPGGVEKKLVGTFTAHEGDSVTIRLKANRQLVLPLDDIASIDRSRGRDRAIGAVLGAVGGAIAGVGLGAVCVSVCPKANSSDPNFAPIGGFVIGLPTGAIVGALIGWERWQRVKFR